MKYLLLISAILGPYAYAAMDEMDENELQGTTAQAGITLSARYEFDSGSRISYSNADADYIDPEEYWLVVDNLTGAIEMRNMKIDLISDFGPAGTTGAVQITLPEEIIYDELSAEGVYLGPGREVGSNHRFIWGVDIDGKLQFPAATRMNIFAIQ